MLFHALILFDTRYQHVRHTESKTGIDLLSLPEFLAHNLCPLCSISISALFTFFMNAYQMWVMIEVTNDP